MTEEATLSFALTEAQINYVIKGLDGLVKTDGIEAVHMAGSILGIIQGAGIEEQKVAQSAQIKALVAEEKKAVAEAAEKEKVLAAASKKPQGPKAVKNAVAAAVEKAVNA